LVAEVARTKHVPPSLLTVARGGIGARIVSAPEEYFQMMDALGVAERAQLEFELESDPGPRFRVQVAQTSGPRSRRVELAAADADAAAARALEEVGDGWKVLHVEAL